MSSNPPRHRSVRAGGMVAVFVFAAGLAAQAKKLDTLKLQNGNVVEGVVLAETETSVTVRIGPGQEVEIPKRLIAKYVRVTGPNDAAKAAAAPAWAPRSAWFRLKNADGRLVGKLYVFVRAEPDGTIRLEQAWRFVGDKRLTIVGRIETVDAKLVPLSFAYNETVTERGSGKVVSSRAVRGAVRHGKLYLDETSTTPPHNNRRAIPFPNGNYFPMLVEEMLRRGEAKGARSFSASVYDPLEGVFELRRYALAGGIPPLRSSSKTKRAGRIIETVIGRRQQREWVSATGKIELIEINGVALVAEPVSQQTAEQLTAFDKARALPTWRAFANLEVWLPRATWSFGPDIVRDRVIGLRTGWPDTDVRVWFLPAEKDNVVLQSVADDVLRRWTLDEPWFKEASTDRVVVGGRPTIRIDGGGKDGNGRLRRGRVFVLEAPGGWLAWTAEGPATTWAYLAVELADAVAALRAPQPAIAAAPGK